MLLPVYRFGRRQCILCRCFRYRGDNGSPIPGRWQILEFKKTEKVLDFDVAKNGPYIGHIDRKPGRRQGLFWDLGSPDSTREWPVPKGFTPRALAWHPAEKSFFLAGKQGNEHVIMRVDKKAGGDWGTKLIYRNSSRNSALVAGTEAVCDRNGFQRR